MPIVNVKGVANQMQFPDDMDINDIRTFLQKKFTRQSDSDLLESASKYGAPTGSTAAPYEPSLMEKASLGIGSALHDSGIISNKSGAYQVGKNVAAVGEMLPGVGDVADIDNFLRAKAEGDNLGMGLAMLGAIPLAGDLLKGPLKKARKLVDDIEFKYKSDIAPLQAEYRAGASAERKAEILKQSKELRHPLDAAKSDLLRLDMAAKPKAKPVEVKAEPDKTFKGKVFHQTSEQFDEFDLSKGADGTAWFTGDKKNFADPASSASAASGKGRVLEREVELKKVAGFDELDKYSIDELRQQGYDGAILDGDIQVFDQKAIKPPVDVASSIKPADAMGEFTKFSDKVAARRGAKLSVWDLPTKGKAENIKHITDLQDYTPEQLVNQMKTLDNVGIRQGGYLKKGDGLDIFYKDNGTSDMIDPKTGNVVFANDVEQTGNIIKDDILNTAEGVLTPEQRATEFQARKANDAINNAREAALQDSYKMQHTAPMRGDNPSGDDLTAVFDKDIYTGNAKRFFGTGASYDDKAIKVIQGMKGKPEKSVTIYRAVPKDVKEINATDWITTTKEYAQDHMEGEKGWHILSKKVKAKDIATDGNSIHEFGYDPIN